MLEKKGETAIGQSVFAKLQLVQARTELCGKLLTQIRALRREDPTTIDLLLDQTLGNQFEHFNLSDLTDEQLEALSVMLNMKAEEIKMAKTKKLEGDTKSLENGSYNLTEQ